VRRAVLARNPSKQARNFRDLATKRPSGRFVGDKSCRTSRRLLLSRRRPLGSTVVVRRQLGDQERKLFCHIYAAKILLNHVSGAVGVGENHFHDLSGAT
jgi:hypothetical protein